MQWYLPIAFKNIFRDRRRSFTLGINYFFVSILLLIVFSLTTGVKKNITENIVSSTAGHITLSGEYVIKGRTFQGIASFNKIDSLVNSLFLDTRIVTRYTVTSSVYYNGLSKRLAFLGISPEREAGLRNQITVNDSTWNAFVSSPGAVLMPRATADYYGIKPLDDILVATRTRFGAFNTATMRVCGTYTTGNYFLRDYIFCHFSFLQSFDLADSVTASKMYLFFNTTSSIAKKREELCKLLISSGYNAVIPKSGEDAINAVASASPRYEILDSTVNRQNLTLATIDEVTGILSKVVSAVNSTGLCVAGIMLFVIAVSIFINLRMTITERMQEIGTLRAIGAERSEVTGLFVTENIFLCLVFVAAGLLAGLIIIFTVSTFLSLPADGALGLFLDKGHLVLQPTVLAVLFITISLAALTALFSWFPARYGAKIPAVQALTTTDT